MLQPSRTAAQRLGGCAGLLGQIGVLVHRLVHLLHGRVYLGNAGLLAHRRLANHVNQLADLVLGLELSAMV